MDTVLLAAAGAIAVVQFAARAYILWMVIEILSDECDRRKRARRNRLG